MDFNLSLELVELRSLVSAVVARVTSDRLRAIEEAAGVDVDAQLWSEFAASDLLGAWIAEEYGGVGLGLGSLAVVLEGAGRGVVPLPLWSSGVAALAVQRYAPDHLRTELLPGIAAGSSRLGLAVEEVGAGPVDRPLTAAQDRGGDSFLTGRKVMVAVPSGACGFVVTATAAEGPGLYLVDAADAVLEPGEGLTTHGEPTGEIHLDQTPGLRLGGAEAVAWLLALARAAVAATVGGTASAALQLAADYTREREQFGRPLGSFQAVQHQLADAWITVENIQLTAWQAIADLEDGVVGSSALVAHWWASHGGLDVLHRVQHVHGGMGVDVDYPVHRYFLWARHFSGALGGPASDLELLGEQLVGR